jgi:hypothetical protein
VAGVGAGVSDCHKVEDVSATARVAASSKPTLSSEDRAADASTRRWLPATPHTDDETPFAKGSGVSW